MFKIVEMSDLFVDACVRDEAGQLVFMSCYGRDTAIQQLLASFQLKPSQGGLDWFRLECDDATTTVFVGDPDRLEKFSGRLPRENLFGNLAHSWIYDPVVMKPDNSNRIAWVIEPEAWSEKLTERLLEKVWRTYQSLSPVPLLDHWREPVLDATASECVTLMHKTAHPPIGRCSAFKVHLGETFLDVISLLVKRRILTLEPNPAALRLAA